MTTVYVHGKKAEVDPAAADELISLRALVLELELENRCLKQRISDLELSNPDFPTSN